MPVTNNTPEYIPIEDIESIIKETDTSTGTNTQYIPDNNGVIPNSGSPIRIKGVDRDARTRHKSEIKSSSRIDIDLNAKKEAIRLSEHYIDDLFEKNNAVTEDRARVIFYNNYIVPLEKMSDKKWNKEQSRHRRIKRAHKRQEREVSDKVYELLLREYAFNHYNDALNKKISEGSIVYRYEPADLRNIRIVPQTVGEEKEMLKIYLEGGIITEETYERKTKKLGNDDLQSLDEKKAELWSEYLAIPWLIVLNDDFQAPSWTKGRKLCKAENAYHLFGTLSDLKDKRGNPIYNLEKRPPHRVGIDLSTGILEYLFLGGRNSTEDIATILSATEPDNSLTKAINTLENMKLISKNRKTYKITPLGRTAYKDVVERCLKDISDHKGIYDALRNTATSYRII